MPNDSDPSSSAPINIPDSYPHKSNSASVASSAGASSFHLVPPPSSSAVSLIAPSSSSSSVVKVDLPGSTLYPDDPVDVDREEFVRLAVQVLRDVGYMESAATLEAESGYVLEPPHSSEFRRAVLEGRWEDVSPALPNLGVPQRDLQAARYIVSKQHYLELLENRSTSRALNVLRSELAPNAPSSDELHVLSSLMMCSDPVDLCDRAKWDGQAGSSRSLVLSDLQRYIPTKNLLPPRRLLSLLAQSRHHQRQSCTYHDPRSPFSLLADHLCGRAGFPTVTTNVLAHEDEVFNLAWSWRGGMIAAACKDRRAVVWRIGPERVGGRKVEIVNTFSDHKYPVTTLAWSKDDSRLITGSEQHLKMWNVASGELVADMKGHRQGVSAISTLPDGSGFITGGMDKAIFFWDMNGRSYDEWSSPCMRVLDLAVTPDGKRLVVVAVVDREFASTSASSPVPEMGFVSIRQPKSGSLANGVHAPYAPVPMGAGLVGPLEDENGVPMRRRVLMYDLATKEQVFKMPMPKEITSLSISADSRYALIGHAPGDLLLWDLLKHRLVRKFTGQQMREDVIRSCFGGVDEDFVLSGSEDGNVYIWRKETGTLVEVLSGHGKGNVNAVAWHPRELGVFASCSDDHTIRIWEAPSPGEEEEISNGYAPDPPSPPPPQQYMGLRRHSFEDTFDSEDVFPHAHTMR